MLLDLNVLTSTSTGNDGGASVLARQQFRVNYAALEMPKPRNTANRTPFPSPSRSSFLQRTDSEMLIDENGDVEVKDNDSLPPARSLFPTWSPALPESLGKDAFVLPPVLCADEKELIFTSASTPPLEIGLAFPHTFSRTFAFFRKHKLTCAKSTEYDVLVFWCGDSRCLRLHNDVFKVLTKDHRPQTPAETTRINNAGGTVIGGRVVSYIFFNCSSNFPNIEKKIDT